MLILKEKANASEKRRLFASHFQYFIINLRACSTTNRNGCAFGTKIWSLGLMWRTTKIEFLFPSYQQKSTSTMPLQSRKKSVCFQTAPGRLVSFSTNEWLSFVPMSTTKTRVRINLQSKTLHFFSVPVCPTQVIPSFLAKKSIFHQNFDRKWIFSFAHCQRDNVFVPLDATKYGIPSPIRHNDLPWRYRPKSNFAPDVRKKNELLTQWYEILPCVLPNGTQARFWLLEWERKFIFHAWKSHMFFSFSEKSEKSLQMLQGTQISLFLKWAREIHRFIAQRLMPLEKSFFITQGGE